MALETLSFEEAFNKKFSIIFQQDKKGFCLVKNAPHLNKIVEID